MHTIDNRNLTDATTIYSLAKDRCTGCGACYNICPEDAIDMKSDPDGYLFPHILEETCTRCGKCATSCPSFSPVRNKISKPQCYAVWADDATREKSSSGGVFTLLAEYVLDKGGTVCGAAFDEGWQVCHILIDDKESLSLLRGSKYVQSDTGVVYTKIGQLLDAGKPVLFSGCPCQVAGLNGFLGRNYNNLTTVDIFCHSVASPGVWQKYLNECFPTKKPQNINFRDKEISGWTCLKCTITLDGKKRITDEYVRGFHQALFARKSCEDCQFTKLPRQGDFTIGDWWGIDKYNKDFNDNKGTSLLLVNTQEKQQIVEFLKTRATLFEPVPLKFIGKNGHINGKLKLHKKRDAFLTMLRGGVPYLKAIRAALDEKYDIGIVGFWYGLNYGSTLTSYAIYKTLEKLGYSVIHLNKPKKLWAPNYTDRYTDKDSMSVIFANKYSNISPLQSKYHKLNEQCDMFLVGSDTVWNPRLVGDYQPLFFLDFADLEKRKIAYASSFARENFATGDPFLQQYCHYACNRLDAVAVREESGVKLMKEEFGREATRVLDPVFFISPDEYRALAETDGDIILPDKFIFSNILGIDGTKLVATNKILDSFALPAINFPNANMTEQKRKKHPLDIISKDSIENWLLSIDKAQLAVSDSFHVTCFAIILRTNFITIVTPNDPFRGRMETLLKSVGLRHRLFYTDAVDSIEEVAKQPIDFDKVAEKLEREKNKSLDWLKEALSAPLAKHTSQRKVIDNIITTLRKQLSEKEDELEKTPFRLTKALNAIDASTGQPLVKEQLRSCLLIRWAFRTEYWRCRLMSHIARHSRKRHYLERESAVKLAFEILFH